MDKDRKVRILVVDDEELICWALKQSFEKAGGYHVSCAYTGGEALQSLNENKYDIVITDLNLPDITDFNIVEKIKGLASGTPVIVISASLCDPFVDDDIIMQQGAYKCIDKPFEIADIISEVREVLRCGVEERSCSIEGNS